jgi:hypothetical protein
VSKWLNRSAGIAGRNGTASHTITFSTDGDAPFTPTNGRLLVMVASGPVTMSWSTGWTEQLQPVNNSELSVATITASSTSSVTITHNGSNYPIQWVIYEFPAGSSWTGGAGASNVSTSGSQPTVTGLPGADQTVFYAVCGARPNASTAPSAAWTSPAIEDLDSDTIYSSTDGEWLTVAYTDDVATTTSTATVTISNGSNLTGPSTERVTFAIDVPGTTAPTVNAGADASIELGDAFNRTASATGAPTSWAWSTTSGPNSPESLGSSATLSWTPVQVGTYTVEAAATNAYGTGTDTLTLTVDPPPPGPGRSFGPRALFAF